MALRRAVSMATTICIYAQRAGSEAIACGPLPKNFSFASGEKGALNRRYRRWQDSRLAKRHRMTDFFFCTAPDGSAGRLEKIFDLASRCSVEVETHPVDADEYQFLTGGELMRRVGDVKIARGYAL